MAETSEQETEKSHHRFKKSPELSTQRTLVTFNTLIAEQVHKNP